MALFQGRYIVAYSLKLTQNMHTIIDTHAALVNLPCELVQIVANPGNIPDKIGIAPLRLFKLRAGDGGRVAGRVNRAKIRRYLKICARHIRPATLSSISLGLEPVNDGLRQTKRALNERLAVGHRTGQGDTSEAGQKGRKAGQKSSSAGIAGGDQRGGRSASLLPDTRAKTPTRGFWIRLGWLSTLPTPKHHTTAINRLQIKILVQRRWDVDAHLVQRRCNVDGMQVQRKKSTIWDTALDARVY